MSLNINDGEFRLDRGGHPVPPHRDSEFFFESRAHRRALASLERAVLDGECFVVLTGDVGTGKTLLLRKLVKGLAAHGIVAAVASGTGLDARELLIAILSAFDVSTDGDSHDELRSSVRAFLSTLTASGRRGLVVVDEAQHLRPDAIDELIDLSQPNDGASLQVLVAGQPKLRHMLSSSTAAARSPLLLFCDVGPLTEPETRSYSAHRLARVESEEPVFVTDDAYHVIYAASGGLPRRIDRLCQRLSMASSQGQIGTIPAELVAQIWDELREEMGVPASDARIDASIDAAPILPPNDAENGVPQMPDDVQAQPFVAAVPARRRPARTAIETLFGGIDPPRLKSNADSVNGEHSLSDGHSLNDGRSVNGGQSVNDGQSANDRQSVNDPQPAGDANPIPDAQSVNDAYAMSDAQQVRALYQQHSALDAKPGHPAAADDGRRASRSSAAAAPGREHRVDSRSAEAADRRRRNPPPRPHLSFLPYTVPEHYTVIEEQSRATDRVETRETGRRADVSPQPMRAPMSPASAPPTRAGPAAASTKPPATATSMASARSTTASSTTSTRASPAAAISTVDRPTAGASSDAGSAATTHFGAASGHVDTTRTPTAEVPHDSIAWFHHSRPGIRWLAACVTGLTIAGLVTMTGYRQQPSSHAVGSNDDQVIGAKGDGEAPSDQIARSGDRPVERGMQEALGGAPPLPPTDAPPADGQPPTQAVDSAPVREVESARPPTSSAPTVHSLDSASAMPPMANRASAVPPMANRESAQPARQGGKVGKRETGRRKPMAKSASPRVKAKRPA